MNPRILRTLVYLVIILAVGLVFSFYKIYDAEIIKNVNTEYSVTVVGLIISVIAFIYAFLTYISIDSVNKITQMEGNVLENENYVTSFTSLISEYDMKESEDFGKKVFHNLEDIFKNNSKTAVQFANNLQYLIDLLVFLPYMYHTKEAREENQRKMGDILTLINKRKEALLAVSNGNLVLIKETVKLIESIINYQKHVDTDEFKIASTLLEVRGNMLRNSVTQMVYYNYLGLFYQKKAIEVLQKRYGIQGNIFMARKIKMAKHTMGTMKNDDKELFVIYLKEAKKSFNKALERGTDDVMWEGFIKYNAARALYLLTLAEDEEAGGEDEWLKMMNEALSARYRLNILIDDILHNNEITHLQEAFIHENNMANLVKLNILMAEGLDVTDRIGQVKYKAPDYQGLEQDGLLTVKHNKYFENIPSLQQEIYGFLQELNPKEPVA